MAERTNTSIVRKASIELGNSGLSTWDGQVTEEFIRNLRGRDAAKIYQEMESNDPVIGGTMHAIIQTARKVPWKVVVDDESNQSTEAAEFAASLYGDMSFSWNHTLTEIFTMFTYGWSYLEKVLKVRKGDTNDPKTRSRFNDSKIGIRKLAPRSQATLDRWSLDSKGGIQGMWQNVANNSDLGGFQNEDLFIPIDRALLFRTISIRNNPEGRSALRPAYRSWYIKKNIEEVMSIGIERDLVGMPFVKLPEGFNPVGNADDTTTLNWVKQMLANIKNDEQAYMILPSDWEFELVASPGNKQFNIETLLAYYDKRIAMSLLGQFIMLGMERVGSFALAESQTNLFKLAMQGWLTSIAETLNRWCTEPILKLNGWVLDEYPQMIPGRIDDFNLDVLSTYVVRLQKAGALTPDDELEEFLRKVGGLTDVPERSSIVFAAKQKGQRRVRNNVNVQGQQDSGSSEVVTRNLGAQPISKMHNGLFVVGIKNGAYHTITSTNDQETAKTKYNRLEKISDDVVWMGRQTGNTENGGHEITIVTESIPIQQVDTNDDAMRSYLDAKTKAIFQP